MEKRNDVKKRKRITVISSSDDETVGQEAVLKKEIGKTKVENTSTLPECKVIVTRLKQRLGQGKEKRTKRIISKFVDDSSDDGNVPHEAELDTPSIHARWKQNLEKLCRRNRDKRRHGERYVEVNMKLLMGLDWAEG